jgi:hypothetical protein
LQSFIGIFLAAVTTPQLTGAIPGISTVRAAVISAAWGGFIAVLSWIQNSLEDAGTVPAMLRANTAVAPSEAHSS